MKSFAICKLSILNDKLELFPEKINETIKNFENQAKTFVILHENISFLRNQLISKITL